MHKLKIKKKQIVKSYIINKPFERIGLQKFIQILLVVKPLRTMNTIFLNSIKIKRNQPSLCIL